MLGAASGTALFFRTPISDRSKVFPVSSGEEMREVHRNSFHVFKWLLPVHACVLSCFSHVWLHDPMGCSLSGSSVHGILQARILEWVAISFSGGASWPRDQTCISCVSCIGSKFFTTRPPPSPRGSPTSAASLGCIKDWDTGWSELQAWGECLFDISPTLPSYTKSQNESEQHKSQAPCHTDWEDKPYSSSLPTWV